MNRTILQDIHNYINFLKRHGYIISLSFMKNHFHPYTAELLEYDFHPHPICNYMKQNTHTKGRCARNKHILEKKLPESPYYSCCYAGVEEFLIPVIYDNITLCCIHVSGYRGKTEKSKVKREEILKLCTEKFSLLYSKLSDNPPSLNEVMSFTNPLSHMLIKLYNECTFENNPKLCKNDLYIKALQYVHENYSVPINCDSIASALGFSSSYIRYIFKHNGELSVQAKINKIRLIYAKRLLRDTNINITDIAYSAGFNDSNYFSTFFKKNEKISPKEYRLKSKTAM